MKFRSIIIYCKIYNWYQVIATDLESDLMENDLRSQKPYFMHASEKTKRKRKRKKQHRERKEKKKKEAIQRKEER